MVVMAGVICRNLHLFVLLNEYQFNEAKEYLPLQELSPAIFIIRWRQHQRKQGKVNTAKQ